MVSGEKLNEIKIQIEYYLSDENLKKDSFFHDKISSDPEGYIDLDLFLKCNKVIKAGWTKEDLIEGIKTSELVELSSDNKKVRRKDNKPLPELALLSKKRKKEETENQEEEKPTIDPTILSVSTENEVKTKWKSILQEFKDSNPDLNVVYGRFKGKSGHFAVLVPPEKELSFKDEFKVEDHVFKVTKCTGDDLIDFWKSHGDHYQLCTKGEKEKKVNKKGKKKSNHLAKPAKLGAETYSDISVIRANARKILNNSKDGEKIEGNDKDFILDILKFHHNYDNKVKDLDYITSGKPEKFEFSRCFFIVKKDGEKTDFSIQKCIEALEKAHSEKDK